MDAITVGIGVLVAVALLVTAVLLFVLSRLFRKVEQDKALIVSKMRKVDVTFTGQVVLPVLCPRRLGRRYRCGRDRPRAGPRPRAAIARTERAVTVTADAEDWRDILLQTLGHLSWHHPSDDVLSAGAVLRGRGSPSGPGTSRGCSRVAS